MKGWVIGGTVEVDFHGTPVEAEVLSAPTDSDDAWVLTTVDKDAWVVGIEEMGIFAVVNRQVVRSLTEDEFLEIAQLRSVVSPS